VGRPKAHSAVEKLQLLNPEVMVEPYQVTLDEDNVEGLVLGHDLVVDCSDAFATRYLVNAACCESGTWLVEGGVLGLAGMVMSVRPRSSACYRCAFPAPPPAAPTCASAGILGPAAGVVGSLMALEAMKLLAGLDGALLDAFLQIDLASGDFLRVATARRPDCPDCG
jgi:molybdopterin/thiamine biosynthesis adenylyltransferase